MTRAFTLAEAPVANSPGCDTPPAQEPCLHYAAPAPPRAGRCARRAICRIINRYRSCRLGGRPLGSLAGGPSFLWLHLTSTNLDLSFTNGRPPTWVVKQLQS